MWKIMDVLFLSALKYNFESESQLGMKAGYYAGGYKPADYAAGSSTPDAYINSELTAALRESNAVNAALLAEIQRGITSKTYIHGEGGIEKAQETYDKLIKNARG